MAPSQKDWIEALNEKVSSLLSDTSIGQLKVQYELVSEENHKLSYYLSVHNGVACIHEGIASDADITFSVSELTATQIHSGALSTEKAFLKGLLMVTGDVEVLIRAIEHLERPNL
jgi:hypothetical protein